VPDQKINQLASNLVNRADAGMETIDIVAAIISTWDEIFSALTPIVGKGGVDALYGRTLHLTAKAHPWLSSTVEAMSSTMDIESFKSMLTRQSSHDAAVAGGEFLQTFYELLSSLIGGALTEQLLRSAWINFSRYCTTQDT
jgi:hypothetical protein